MLRKSYLLGVAGLLMMGLGVSLYLRGSVYRLSLLYWLGGPLLCFAGAALFMGAILCPISIGMRSTLSRRTLRNCEGNRDEASVSFLYSVSKLVLSKAQSGNRRATGTDRK